MDGCHTPLLISIVAQEAMDAVAKDRVRDVGALKVRIPLCKIGSHVAVRLDEWQQTRTRESLVNSVQGESGDIFTYLTHATQRTDFIELCLIFLMMTSCSCNMKT